MHRRFGLELRRGDDVTLVCIFAKEPLPGRVKTRLARAVGDRAAAELAAAFLDDTCAAVAEAGLDAVLAWSGDPRAAPRGIEVWPQGDGDLGARIERVLCRALSNGRPAIALGADSPGMPCARLVAAASALAYKDAVVGPARDGGFYLLGVRCFPSGLLDGVRWSSPRARADAVSRLSARGMSIAELPIWFDVDEQRDLARLAGLLRRRIVRAEATARLLARLP